MHRINQHADSGIDQPDPLQQIDAVPLLQAQVDHEQIGSRVAEHFDRGPFVPRLAADLQVGLVLDQEAQALPQHFMVVDQHDAGFFDRGLLFPARTVFLRAMAAVIRCLSGEAAALVVGRF